VAYCDKALRYFDLTMQQTQAVCVEVVNELYRLSEEPNEVMPHDFYLSLVERNRSN
jgi:hypothetical protein